MLGFCDALRRMRELTPVTLPPGHGPACRSEEMGRMLDELEKYVEHIAAIATTSYAAGLPLGGGGPEGGRERPATPPDAG